MKEGSLDMDGHAPSLHSGQGHPMCCDICTRGMSISLGYVRAGLMGG